jgi:membrane-associated phospholipid phosphatase
MLLGGLVTLSPRAYLALRVLPPVIVFTTTTYLAFHWITDSIAGLFLGLILAHLMARVPWDSLPLPRLNGWAGPAGLRPR